ncbi:hypothetical protein JW930_06805 [Candidatus Woesearchaeota archaeon]|nr:hypothetical protein [Candidatus Woesearchaeota archaeon]
MVVQELSKLLEKRRDELIALLEHDANIELEKQHQIYGAINEIEIFLQTLNYYRDKEIKAEVGDIQLVAPPEKQGLFTRIFEKVKERIFRNR